MTRPARSRAGRTPRQPRQEWRGPGRGRLQCRDSRCSCAPGHQLEIAAVSRPHAAASGCCRQRMPASRGGRTRASTRPVGSQGRRASAAGRRSDHAACARLPREWRAAGQRTGSRAIRRHGGGGHAIAASTLAAAAVRRSRSAAAGGSGRPPAHVRRGGRARGPAQRRPRRAPFAPGSPRPHLGSRSRTRHRMQGNSSRSGQPRDSGLSGRQAA